MRHSGASSLIIEIAVADDLTINVIDNGRGIPNRNQRRSGPADMAHGAEQADGDCQISRPPTGGTHVRWSWTAPLASL